ncbi:fimbrial protein [Type-D symbiont of Plautia stali]|uniref:fimbrial protein n=1 Tax=Type-D symbiont of Plautia stali TaxID=1560356 RepID=UPI000AB7D397|nr:fimbrial protein [Type-D symbiont of Plautia stali]
MQIIVIAARSASGMRKMQGSALISCAILFSSMAQAGFTDGLVDGNYGVIRAHGTLTESACRLDMRSADQSVSLGNIATGKLQNPGDTGNLVPVALYLHDCLRTSSANRDVKGNLTWSASQPAASFTFTGIEDIDNPQLIKTHGVEGIGLRIKDALRNNVTLGQRGKPLLITPASHVVIYYIAPERTHNNLRAGSYFATVNFRLNYD